MDEQKIKNIFQAIINHRYARIKNKSKNEIVPYLKEHYRSKLRKKKNKKHSDRFESYLDMLEKYPEIISEIRPTVTKESKPRISIVKKLNKLARNGDSKEFYKSDEWRELRTKRLKIDNYKCKECGSKIDLHVHHKKGKKVTNKLKTLVTLCKWCHQKKHPWMKVQSSKIENLPMWMDEN